MHYLRLLLFLTCFLFMKALFGAIEQLPNSHSMQSQSFEITFEYFSPAQLSQIEAFYKQFSEYRTHTIVKQSSSRMQLDYKSDIDKDLLLHNLNKTFEKLGFEVLLRHSENRVNIRLLGLLSKSIPYQQW